MREVGPGMLLLSASLAAFAVVVASRLVIAQAAAESPVLVVEGPTLEEFSRERRSLEFSLGRLVDEGKWEAAEEEAERLLRLDPISAPARQALARSREERSARRELEAALALRDAGEEERALRALRAIPPGTDAHARAGIEAMPIADRIARRARGDCLGLAKAGQHARALERCRLHLDLVCQTAIEPDLVERVRWLERRLRVDAEEAWSCPGGASETGEGDARVREILRAWERGEAGEHAALRLERLAARGVEEARALVAPMRRAESSLREGLAALLEGDLERARPALDRVAAAEETILGGRRSLRYRESVQRFGRLALERGLDLAAKRRHAEALRILREGAALDPANTEILRALWRIEDAAGP